MPNVMIAEAIVRPNATATHLGLTVFKKVMVNQLVSSPIMNSLFYGLASEI